MSNIDDYLHFRGLSRKSKKLKCSLIADLGEKITLLLISHFCKFGIQISEFGDFRFLMSNSNDYLHFRGLSTKTKK